MNSVSEAALRMSLEKGSRRPGAAEQTGWSGPARRRLLSLSVRQLTPNYEHGRSCSSTANDVPAGRPADGLDAFVTS